MTESTTTRPETRASDRPPGRGARGIRQPARLIAAGSLALGALIAAPPAAHAETVDLCVLLVATGPASQDSGRALMEELFERVGVCYDALDSSADALTADMLSSGSHGYYNGIILTQTDTYVGPGTTGLSLAEFELLRQYERDFGVREAVIAGYPTTNPALGLDYGMTIVSATPSFTGRWQAPAGGTEYFEYVNAVNTLPVEGFAFLGAPRNDPAGPVVTPLLVDDAHPQKVAISILSYPDGREVLLSTIDNAWFSLHSQVLAYEFLNFATQGVFLGARKVYLTTHIDDVFMADEVWNPATEENWPEDVYAYQMTADDLNNAVAADAAFRANHPLFSEHRLQMTFNGIGADPTPSSGTPQTLSEAMMFHKDALRFINHTFGALQMDRLCPDPDEPPVSVCPVTDYATAYAEIDDNRAVWQAMGLPEYNENLTVLVADSHSGLHDRNSTPEDFSDDIPFPAGANPDFLQAAQDLGVQCIASDPSMPNQDVIQWVPGYDLVLMPRWPASIFYNTTTPAENTSEYNYIFHYRHIDAGLDPCATPGAICTPRTYQEILDAEADTAVRHMLSFGPSPHFFHQSNLRDYDGLGNTLHYDWLEAVAARYEELFNLPVKSPLYHELNTIARDWLSHRESGVQGYLDTATERVTLWASVPSWIHVTGLAGGEVYGGQRISRLAVNATPQTYDVDCAIGL